MSYGAAARQGGCWPLLVMLLSSPSFLYLPFKTQLKAGLVLGALLRKALLEMRMTKEWAQQSRLAVPALWWAEAGGLQFSAQPRQFSYLQILT